MFSKLEVFQTSFAMARHAGARQAVIARNIANADTPGFRAQAIAPFRDHYRDTMQTSARATRAGHLNAATMPGGEIQSRYADTEPTPNGNSVALEKELVSMVEVQREHDRALAIYRHSLDVLRTTLGRR